MTSLRPEADTEDMIKKSKAKQEQAEHLAQDIYDSEQSLKKIQAKLYRKRKQLERLTKEISVLEEQLGHVNADTYKVEDKTWRTK